MPSVTLPTSEDKNTVRRALPTSRIVTAAVARLHIAYPSSTAWSYTNVWGAATFCKDKKKANSFFIRIVDLEQQRGVLWEQELYEGFDYVKECPFFHTFGTDEHLAGLEFVDQGEADTFYKKVTNRESIKLKEQAGNWKISKRISKNDIGEPSDFRHVGHIGYSNEKGFSVQANDANQDDIVAQLKALGITPEEIDKNQDFIKQFLNQHTGPSSSSPPPRIPSSPLPTLPPSKAGRRPPPPPPPRRKAGGIASPPPPPPPAPARPSPAMPSRPSIPPPPVPSAPRPAFGGAGAPPPPPPPPSMAGGGGPPVPPPPPGPPAAAPAGVPASSDGRSNLMASIRATGGFGSLKKTGHLRDNGSPTPTSSRGSPVGSAATVAAAGVGAGAAAAAGGAGGGDLASSIAAVLKQRQNALQSDDEDDEDDDWE
ncbi:hypothetical protein BC940DRAFT_331670 [Gongronella butleri]|nr:hypothetical protein BC940DRAFT_331670 [Gongronella butleri]